MLSLNEVGGAVLKAARGAGFPLGCAEDLAAVAAYFIGIGGKAGVISDVLMETPTRAKVTWEDDTLVVHEGAAAIIAPIVCDAFKMGYNKAVLADPAHRTFVGAALAANDVSLMWDGLTILRSDTNVITPTTKAVNIPQTDWAIWQGLAAKTYVPASEASRLAGAGAGLTDND